MRRKQIVSSVGNAVLSVPCRILRSGKLRNVGDDVPYKSERIFALVSVFLHSDKRPLWSRICKTPGDAPGIPIGPGFFLFYIL